MFMTVGDADTFWHPQFFSTVTLEFEEDPVTHFVVLPDLQKDEGMLRDTLVNLSRSPFGTEIHAHCVGGATVDRSHDIQHGDVRIGGPHEPGLLFFPRLLLVHNVVRPGMSSLGAGL